ncbi:hypothetical protein EKI59_09805 [Corynebacterium sanguinis]|uniref:TrwC relaxase domain-containing protein n=2 Tax=Corynebacterium sanguinis TaxID=2594913 RepID=A0A6C1TX72_9CORY|nr:hypothetical protein EKI59_09805 [Corynebacterium sanguinis]
MRAVHAGDGYAYLLSSVASHDDETRPELRLHDYYDQTGTPPGRWFGRGFSGLGETAVAAGGVVEENHMAALYGEGLHPDVEQRVEDGATVASCQLGRQYATYSKGVAVLEAIKKAENEHKKATGKLLSIEDRNRIGLETARPFYAEATGNVDAGAREVLAWLNEEKNKVRQPVSGMDLTFSPAKSVSVVWALADDDTRKAIQDIHERSVSDALAYVEDNLLFTRTGARGERQIKAAGMMAATFMHYDTREGDPDLHTHCLISNKVQADESAGLSPADAAKWRALDTRFLFKNSAKAGQIYTRMMNQRLSEELGFALRERTATDGKSSTWEIAGVSDEAIDAFSSRRAMARPVYEKYAAEYTTTHGHQPSARARYRMWQQAILDTRDAKKPAQSLKDHRAAWASQYDAAALMEAVNTARDTREYFPAVSDIAAESFTTAVTELARQAVEDARERRSHFAPRHLHTAISMRMNQWRFTSEAHEDTVREAATRYAMDHLVTVATDSPEHLPTALVRFDGMAVDRDSESVVLTAHATLEEEATVLDRLDNLTAYVAPRVAVDAALAAHEQENGFALNDGQELLVRHLTETGAQITAGVGPAGTGKTASMAVVARTWQSQGHAVIGLAPSAAAAENLAEDIGAHARTLASLTYRWRGIVGEHPRDVSALGVNINPGDMLLIDEAGMATTADLAAVVEIAEATGAVVRMVGDPHQLDAVETGGLFRTIVKRDESVELDQVMRMGSDTEQAAAGLKLRHGDETGLNVYAERGWIHEGLRGDMVTQAARDYLADEAQGRSGLLIASTRADVNAANQIIQDARIEAGRIDPETASVQLGTGHRAWQGDTILARKNTTIDGVRILNGMRLTVTRINDDGTVAARSTDGHTWVQLPADYVRDHVQLGYAATVHRAQGATVDVTRAIIGPETDRRGLYVAVTRGKAQNHLYVATDMSIDLGAEDAHLHMAGDTDAPTGRAVLEKIVATDAGQISATDAREEITNASESAQRKRELYMTACDMLTHDWRRNVVEPAARIWLDRLPVALTETMDEDKGVERIATAAVALARHGIDYRELMGEATSDLDGARDVGAVIDHRLRQHLPDTRPELPALPPRHAGTDDELYSWAKNTAEELTTPVRDLRACNVALPEKGIVENNDFTHMDLRGRDLSNLRFVNCDFTGAALDNTEMHRTLFTDCAMREATLTGIHAGQGDSSFKLNGFRNCDMRGADFSGAHLARTNVTRSNLSGSIWQRAEVDTTVFTGVDFTAATFTDATFSDATHIVGGELDDDAPERMHMIKNASQLDLPSLEDTSATTSAVTSTQNEHTTENDWVL